MFLTKSNARVAPFSQVFDYEPYDYRQIVLFIIRWQQNGIFIF